jgi:hypothetical protein
LPNALSRCVSLARITESILIMSRPPDRAAVATIAIMQMIATARSADLRQAIEDYLRDEFANCAREVMADTACLTRE